MRKLFVVLFSAVLSTACGFAAPDAGHETVLIRKPLLFGHGGVDPSPVKTGRTWVALTTDTVDVDMRPVQFNEHFDDLMSSDGVPLDFDAVIRLRVTDSVRLVAEFGLDFYKSNVQAEFRKLVRDEVKKHGMNETAINAAAAEEIDNAVTTALTAVLREANIPVAVLAVTLGRANPPDSIKGQRTETAVQEQRVNTERLRQQAEQQRKAAETTRAEADNAYREGMRLSPEQFIQLEQIKGLSYIATKANGFTVVYGGAVPTLGVR